MNNVITMESLREKHEQLHAELVAQQIKLIEETTQIAMEEAFNNISGRASDRRHFKVEIHCKAFGKYSPEPETLAYLKENGFAYERVRTFGETPYEGFWVKLINW